MENLIRILIDRLAYRGMELTNIPAFIRNVANTLAANPDLSLHEINQRLQILGWDDFELDYFSLQLVIATFEWNPLGEQAHWMDPTAVHLRSDVVPDKQDEQSTALRSC